MDLDISPNHSESLPLGDLSSQAFLTISLEASKALDWHIEELDETGFIAYTNFSVTSWAEEVTLKVKNNKVIIESECSGKESCGWDKNRQNVELLINKTSELKSNLTTEQLAVKMEAFQEQVIANAGNKTPKKNKSLVYDLRGLFIPVKGYFVTPLLMTANIVILILMAYSGASIGMPEMEMMLNWGANTRQLIIEGEAWRFLTSCFLHFGIMHLLMNMIALYYIGYLLEPRLGSIRFIFCYLMTGVCASVVSTWWHVYGVSAGASGAIFGMYGVFLAFLTTRFIEKSVRKELLGSISVFIIYNLIAGQSPGIDNAAHIGGLISGVVIGYAMIPSLLRPNVTAIKLVTVAILLSIMSGLIYFTIRSLPNDLKRYEDKMVTLSSMENMALEVLALPAGTPKEELLIGLNDRGIYYWNENIKLLDEFAELDLPPVLEQRNAMLRTYCSLRIKSYELMSKSITEDTPSYNLQIADYNKQISEVLQQLQNLDKH